nr:hypothetical protein [Mycobacterium marinum]
MQSSQGVLCVADCIVFTRRDDGIECVSIRRAEVGVLFHLHRLRDQVIKVLQLNFEGGDSSGSAFLRLSQRCGDLLQMGSDLGQLLGLSAQRLGCALHLGGIVDGVLAVLVIPGSFKASAGLLKRNVRLGSAASRSVKRGCQVGNLSWATSLEALVDRPGITSGIGD